ncbi:MAG: hypothetical protein LWX51_08940 [Deltaproteobacteria bacterium]|nr:hypothetical protein [Deltaproteobacteria bacterium]
MERADRVGGKNGNPACHRHVYYAVHALCCPAFGGQDGCLAPEYGMSGRR